MPMSSSIVAANTPTRVPRTTLPTSVDSWLFEENIVKDF